MTFKSMTRKHDVMIYDKKKVMKRDRNCLMFLNYTKDYQYSHLSFVFVCLLTVLRESLYVSQNLTHTVDLPRNNRKKNQRINVRMLRN